MMMKRLWWLVRVVFGTGIVLVLAGCSGGGYSIYSGYGYPRYGYDLGYHYYHDHDYHEDRYEHRRDVARQRREDRVERTRKMSPEQRQHLSRRLQQTRPQRLERRQIRRANRPVRNMGRPRPAVRRR